LKEQNRGRVFSYERGKVWYAADGGKTF